jgi:hypothetical protein
MPAKITTPTRAAIPADIIGVVVLGLQVLVLFRWILPAFESRLAWGVVAYGLLACGAMYMWHARKIKEMISEPGEWAATIGGSVVLGALSFGVDVMLGAKNNPGLSLLETATKSGSPLGFPLTVLLCPGLTVVAIAGLIRSFFPGTQSPSP